MSKNFNNKKKTKGDKTNWKSEGHYAPNSSKYTRSKHINEKPTSAKFNDPSWYTKIAAAGLSARKAFTRPVGRPLKPDDLGVEFTNDVNSYDPGICVLHYIPAVGATEEGVQSPIDKAANKLWMEFRTKNTGAITYDAADIILNLVAGVNIHTFYYDMSRLYGLLHKSMVTTNDYIPKYAVISLGYDYDDFMDNIADFGIWLNTISTYINDNIHIPNTFTLYDRYKFMNLGIYKDEDLDKFQVYAFKCDGYYRFNERIEGEPGRLELAAMPAMATFEDVKTYFWEMWNAYALSESMADIQSGYFKYFGGGFHLIPTLALDYIVEPVYSADVLKQINNAIFVGSASVNDTYIGQNVDTGFIEGNYRIEYTGPGSNAIPDAYLLNAFKDIPDENDVLEMTRGMSTWMSLSEEGEGANRSVHKYIRSCGSEIFTTFDIGTFYYDSVSNNVQFYVCKDMSTFLRGLRQGVMGSEQYTTATTVWMYLLDAFSYHPNVLVMQTGTDGEDRVFGVYVDRANLTLITNDELQRINELVIISQFTIT